KYQFKVVTDAQTRIAAIKSNQADATDSGGLTRAELKTAEGPTVKSYQDAVGGYGGMFFNMNNPGWKDIRARMAFNKAFDRPTIIDQINQGDGVLAGAIPSDFKGWSYTPDELKQFNAYKYDPAEAKKLWDAAGKPFTAIEYYITPPAQSTTAAPQA